MAANESQLFPDIAVARGSAQIIFFSVHLKQLIQQMKLQGSRYRHQQDSSSSYGHELRLRQRREGWPGEEKSRRISEGKRDRLIAMVTKENYRIKEAGRLLGISYSTAKKIFTNFRIELRAKKESETGDEERHGEALFREIPEGSPESFPRIGVFSSIAGQLQAAVPESKLFNKQ